MPTLTSEQQSEQNKILENIALEESALYAPDEEDHQRKLEYWREKLGKFEIGDIAETN